MTQRIQFAGVKLADDTDVELSLTGTPGSQVDDRNGPGDVTIAIIGPDFETVIDLQLPQARAVAAAILALADYVDTADRSAHKRASDAAE